MEEVSSKSADGEWGHKLLWGHGTVLSPLFLEKNQTVLWRTTACLVALAVRTLCSCALDTKGRLCFLSVLADGDDVGVRAEPGT